MDRPSGKQSTIAVTLFGQQMLQLSILIRHSSSQQMQQCSMMIFQRLYHSYSLAQVPLEAAEGILVASGLLVPQCNPPTNIACSGRRTQAPEKGQYVISAIEGPLRILSCLDVPSLFARTLTLRAQQVNALPH
jgi:hypothetical protein